MCVVLAPAVLSARFARQRAWVRRLAVGARAEQAKATQEEDGEPVFHMVHSVPGAGKSKLVQLLCEAFQNVLGWAHGVHFVCLAFQNAAVALADGYAIHHWPGMHTIYKGVGH